jgi:hypothetical protein
LIEQNNRCAICFEVFTKTPHIDHDHETNEFRGLLCRSCNHLLGNARDKILILENAIQYLKRYGVKMKKHKFSHTIVEHHEDGSHTVHHVHEKHKHVDTTPKRDGDVKGAAGDHDALMDHIMDHTSQPNPGEMNDAANQPMPGAGAPPPGAAGAPPVA